LYFFPPARARVVAAELGAAMGQSNGSLVPHLSYLAFQAAQNQDLASLPFDVKRKTYGKSGLAKQVANFDK